MSQYVDGLGVEGMARQGWARRVEAGSGVEGQGRHGLARRVRVGNGTARQVWPWLGVARTDRARRGTAGMDRQG